MSYLHQATLVLNYNNVALIIIVRRFASTVFTIIRNLDLRVAIIKTGKKIRVYIKLKN